MEDRREFRRVQEDELRQPVSYDEINGVFAGELGENLQLPYSSILASYLQVNAMPMLASKYMAFKSISSENSKVGFARLLIKGI